MRDNIINVLKNTYKAISIDELQDLLEIKTVEEATELSDELRKLEDEAIIYHTNKDKYMMIENSHLRKGIMRANKKGFGFVEIDNMEDDIYISQDNMNGAIHDDIVLVEITSKMTLDRLEGRILKILERRTKQYIGLINFDNKGIGHINDPGVDILSIIYKYNINIDFPDDVKAEVAKMPMEVRDIDLRDRRDLRDQVIFTIDGDDTKDIDDAISSKKMSNGHYELGVHIADVSYYVKEGSPLDNEAMERGTSVYLVDRVIPMLPHELSNGICSLNPNVDRLAVSCVMEFDNTGKQLNYEIFQSVIKSRIQMTYKKVNKVLEDNEIPEGYEEFANDLKLMQELAEILRKSRTKRGYIDFDVDEAKILVDENCVPTEVTLRYRGKGEKLIEDFMIAANECVATHIYFMNLPFVYRIHEYPKEEKIRSFLGFVSNLGYHINGDIKDVKPTTMQKILDQLRDKPDYKILCTLLLRSMQKAVYKPENLGHYGLASNCYTHFTSPIRRYPDTTVHRLLHTYLFDGKMDMATIKKWEERLVYITEHSSERERASVDCEREVEDMKMAEYMEKHIGEEFEGMISSVTSFGMFVELDNLIEGLVPIKDMDDFYHFDEEKMTLTGEKNHLRYSIGERVVVKVIRASKEDKTIDFEVLRKVD